MKCPKCGADDLQGKFCKHCGERLPQLCTQCEKPVTTKFCRSCGQRNPTIGDSTTPNQNDGEGTPSKEEPTPNPIPKTMAPSSLESLRGIGTIEWRKGNLLGKGSFGSVYLGMLAEGRLSAVKCVELGSIAPDSKELQQLTDEIVFMSTHRHENIVSYYGCSYNSQEKQIEVFMEYVAGGSIQNLWKQFEGFPPTALRSYTRQILQGLKYLHGHNIAHRDIKGDNILVDNDGRVKLADFGCSKKLNDICSKTHGCSTMVGTPYWMAPEVITEDVGYGLKADIWSVGCTVVEMLTGKPPWPEFNSMWAAIYHIANCKDKPSGIPEDLDDDTDSFLTQCFERNVELRPSVDMLLLHPFVASKPLSSST